MKYLKFISAMNSKTSEHIESVEIPFKIEVSRKDTNDGTKIFIEITNLTKNTLNDVELHINGAKIIENRLIKSNCKIEHEIGICNEVFGTRIERYRFPVGSLEDKYNKLSIIANGIHYKFDADF